MNFIEEDNMIPNELPDELRSIRHINTYTVPSHYFDGLADEIMNQVRLSQIPKAVFDAPPASYFDNLAGSILSKIHENNRHKIKSEVQVELEEIEPSLAMLSNENVYAVPQGYFDSFEVKIPKHKELTPVRKLSGITSWMKYAVAAVVTGTIATGIIIFADNKGGNNASYEKVLAKVPDNEIDNYLDKNAIADIDFVPASQEISNVTSSEGLMKTLLNNVSDNEIQQYLKNNSDGDENDIKGI